MEVDFSALDNQELSEIFAILKGMDDSLQEYEEILKKGSDENENDNE